MRARSGTTALVAGVVAGTMALAASAGGQAAPTRTDSAPHFALFMGPQGTERGIGGGFELGGSGDFRWSPIPVPLRLSLSFSQRRPDYYTIDTQRGGKASLELVMRPFPRKLGIQPYFLGGLGVATSTGFTRVVQNYRAEPPDFTLVPYYYTYTQPRQSWAFASAGMGLDIGRAFIQLKVENPVATNGPVTFPINVGFRFWD